MHINKFLFFLLLLLFNCQDQETSFTPNEPIDNNNVLLEDLGRGLIYETFNEKTIPIYYYIPSNVNSSTPVVFNIHGGGRDGESTRNMMEGKADQYGFIIVAPEISNINFPGGDGFNLGNVYEDGDNPTPESLNEVNEWAFSIIEPKRMASQITGSFF